MTPIRAVLFDWGGVLIQDPTPGMIAFFAERWSQRGVSESQVPERLLCAFQTGEISEGTFWEALREYFQVELPDGIGVGTWREAFEHTYAEQTETFEWARQLQQTGVRTGVLSNTEEPGVALFESRGYTCFDELIFSCECGFAKPEPAIYRHALERLQLSPEEVLFFDDKAINVEAAKAAGMWAIRFENFLQAKREVKQLGLSFAG